MDNIKKPKPTSKSKRIKTALGIILIGFAIILLLSFFSFFSNWQQDQSQLAYMADKNQLANNVFGKVGAWLGHVFIYNSFGLAAVIIPIFLFIFGLKFIIPIPKLKRSKLLLHSLFFLAWLPVFLGLILPSMLVMQGVLGFESNSYLNSLIGKLGVGILLFISLLLYLVLEWKLTLETFKQEAKQAFQLEDEPEANNKHANQQNTEATSSKPINTPPHANVKTTLTPPTTSVNLASTPTKEQNTDTEGFNLKTDNDFEVTNTLENQPEQDITLSVEPPKEEEESKLSNKALEEFGEYDPTLELSNYQFPTIDLLNNYDTEGKITIDQKELEANKNRIVETLANYKIGIEKIKATIGPTVTLYEIVPEAGIRISKIKNLEDDIALSLSALGIRIIAPIPGRGTIGIEVPNSHTSIVSMRSVIASPKFQENKKMALPIAFGKTISNETFVADLAKMPHLLMAGATGQGKSVGLNAIITSLLYKKHPAELKFVFVDPKKVELTLYNKIERHFLAKLPDSDDAIITDNNKVINTLNSLCIEMDDRYELLKNAYVRNIKEYNDKFKQRKLNPENDHRFLPYIVLVVDEFADLIMTAGKEVEMPIARLAQLARAVGIHLIIATQRPSVNVITGIIKANFPARVAFRVTSKIDSRTILDSGGADQLIGKGDMLFTTGSDLVRLQCAFIDTPEVDLLTEFIGSQRGYASAHLLPEYVGESTDSNLDMNLDERDDMFEEAARLLVNAQQGSTSLIQRKLKLGYNRAGRIIDQLEAAGVVGPFEGSKARQVLVPDEYSLEQLLNNLNQST